MGDFEGPPKKKGVERFPSEHVLLRNFTALLAEAQAFTHRITPDGNNADKKMEALHELLERVKESREAMETLREALAHPEVGEEYARLQSEGARQSYGVLEEALRSAKREFGE